jgi:hypothetical protein
MAFPMKNAKVERKHDQNKCIKSNPQKSGFAHSLRLFNNLKLVIPALVPPDKVV